MSKLINIEKALELVKPKSSIVSGLGAAEGRAFLENLHTIYDKVKKVKVTTCLPMYPAKYFADDAYIDRFQMDGWFFTRVLINQQKKGSISYIPNNLHFAGTKRLAFEKPHIYVGNATPADKHGFHSLSLSNVYEKQMIEAADIVILEINKNLPRTFGDVQIHTREVDYIIETEYEIPVLPDIQPNEKDKIIGKYIAEYINDGDCIQVGIGGIPNAVVSNLKSKKNLGVHTEMMTSGMVDLVKDGIINGEKKNFNKGKLVCAFALGNKELYEFMDNNVGIEIKAGSWVNDPYIIAKNDNQISINTSLEIDLTGQCASESIGSKQFSGSGGQSDTAVGAQMSKNGKSFIALYSTQDLKNKETNEITKISKIVPFLKPGAAVTLSRNDVDYVVTEYGVAHLRGASIDERVKRLIKIAHPEFKDDLKTQAKSLGIIA